MTADWSRSDAPERPRRGRGKGGGMKVQYYLSDPPVQVCRFTGRDTPEQVGVMQEGEVPPLRL